MLHVHITDKKFKIHKAKLKELKGEAENSIIIIEILTPLSITDKTRQKN